jgi:nesprin-1
MKWLLKTLDFLVSHAPEDVVHAEQKKLEELVARYKVLIPTIEITMIKTEVFSKCYTYRQDVSTIVALLEKISSQAASQTEQQPENLNSVKQMIKAQEFAMNQLDNQRGHIMTMLQRGKDLSKDVHAPGFITEEVKSLETGWNQTYSNTQEKLHTLKSVESIWQQFDNQKREIMNLVNLAETELRSVTPLQTNPTNCITDLQNKQQLQVHLQKSAVPLFAKLGQLYESLANEAPVKEEQFVKDIDDLHKRFGNTLDHLKDRVDYLENYNSRWNDYKKRLADLHAWATQIVPQVIESIKSSDLPPEERKQKLEKLEVEFNEKMRTFELLSSDAFELAPKEGNIMEAKKLKNEVRNLHATMNAINNAIQSNAQVINQDLSHWEQYQSQINEIKPWVEDAPKPLSIEDYQPTVLNDAKQFYNEIELYKQQCQKKVAKLDEIAKIGEEIQLNEFLPNDIEFYQAKWKKVQDNTNILGGKMGTLINNWQLFNDQAGHLENWIDESNSYLKDFEQQIAQTGIDELEKHLNTMKFFENEISEKQSNLVSLNQLSEKLYSHLTPEGVAILKEKLKIIKAQMENIAKKVGEQVNGIGMKIGANQEINSKLLNFNNWMENLRKNAIDVDDVSVRNIEPSLQIIHSLLEQHNEREAVFNDIYMEIKKLSATATPSEATVINDTYSALANSYQSLNNNLYDKKEYLEKWVEFLHWTNDVKEFIKHQGKQISDAATIAPAEIEHMSENITEYLSNVPQWKTVATSLDAKPVVRVSL